MPLESTHGAIHGPDVNTDIEYLTHLVSCIVVEGTHTPSHLTTESSSNQDIYHKPQNHL